MDAPILTPEQPILSPATAWRSPAPTPPADIQDLKLILDRLLAGGAAGREPNPTGLLGKLARRSGNLYRRSPEHNLRRVTRWLRRQPAGKALWLKGRLPLDGPPSSALSGTLDIHFTDIDGLDHRFVFSGDQVGLLPAGSLHRATLHTSWDSYYDFFANRKSAQLLFLDGDWTYVHPSTEYYYDQGSEPAITALESLLPAPYLVPNGLRENIRAASRRLGDTTEVTQCGNLDTDIFKREYARKGVPVVLRDAQAHWPAFDWSMQSIASLYGHRYNHLSYYPDFSFSIGTFLDRIISGDKVSFKACLPLIKEVCRYFRLPTFFPQDTYFQKAQAMLVAPSDMKTHASYRATVWHHDLADNFLMHLVGRKKVFLAPPSEEACFYLQTAKSTHINVEIDYSPVDHRYPDPQKFPLYSKLRPIQVILEPGDTLFIPCGWFHNVENLTATASINCWKIDPPSEVPVS